jgi:hypothetical protein
MRSLVLHPSVTSSDSLQNSELMQAFADQDFNHFCQMPSPDAAQLISQVDHLFDTMFTLWPEKASSMSVHDLSFELLVELATHYKVQLTIFYHPNGTLDFMYVSIRQGLKEIGLFARTSTQSYSLTA